MTEQELEQQRAANWRTTGEGIRTIEDARRFIDSIGFCIMYPDRSLPLVPTFIGAYAGSAAGLPDAKHAFADPRAQEATDLMVRLLREKSAFEMSLSEDTTLVISAALFPYFYALVSDRLPKSPPKTKAQGAAVSELATRIFAALQKQGPLSREQLRMQIARETSLTAFDRALGELWSILKIDISLHEAISALLSKYLEAVVAAEQEEIEQFFSHVASRSKIREAVNALLQARELSFISVGAKSLIHMTPPPEQERRRRHG